MKPVDTSQDVTTLDSFGDSAFYGALAVGGGALVLAIVFGVATQSSAERFFHAYLIAFAYMTSISLGALFFVLIQHLVGAGWSVVVRRIAEAAAANILPLAVLFIPILFGMQALYPWSDAKYVAGDALLQHKAPYLNTPFFIARAVLYFAVWIWLAMTLYRRSLAQDRSGDESITSRNQAFCAPGTLLFALTLTFASFDWLMSTEPHWFSTIYGVYYFAGSALGFMAFLALAVFALQRSGRLVQSISVEHYHDIGKLMFGFVIFWAYIAFSQYLLYWYANIPEETAWYLKRQVGNQLGPWTTVSVLLLVGHFVLPFLYLLSRATKRRPPLLAAAAVWVLVMHYVDLYWLVMPEASPESATPAVVDILLFVGMAGLFVAGTVYWLRGQSLIPARDPRLAESLAFENA